jgi:ABC-type uncharacterized transport system substrate-binding protein
MAGHTGCCLPEQILKGAKLSGLLVKQLTKFELVINLEAAR